MPSVQAPDREGGFTLVELLVTVVIMGMALAALLGGLGTAVIVSDQHRQQAVASALVRSYAEAVAAKAAATTATTWVACPTAATYAPSQVAGYGYSEPASYNSTFKVWYWKPADAAFTSASCNDTGAYRVELTVTGQRASETLDVVVRKAAGA